MQYLKYHLFICFIVSAAIAAPNFDVNSKVGSSRAANGTRWTCVLNPPGGFSCAFSQDDGLSWGWCEEQAFPFGMSASFQSGIYLVPDAPVGDGFAFISVTNAAGVSNIIEYQLSKPPGPPSCAYYVHHEPAPYITGNPHPALGGKLAIANDFVPNVYVFAVVPSGDPAQVALVALQVANGGSGAWHWEYSLGFFGIVSHRFDPNASLGANMSNMLHQPVIGVRDNDTTVMSAVYRWGGNWFYVPGSSIAVPIGNSIAVAAVPPQLNQYADSLFTVGADGNLYEDKLTCPPMNCLPGNLFLNGVVQQTVLGNLDSVSDSVAGSWFQATGGPWARAYTRESNSSAWSIDTDYVFGGWRPAEQMIIAGSGFPAGATFSGQQSLVRLGAVSDEMYAACNPINPTVCTLRRSQGASDYSWILY